MLSNWAIPWILFLSVISGHSQAMYVPFAYWKQSCLANDTGLVQYGFGDTSVPFPAPQTAGNTIIVVIAWATTSGTVTGISDTAGNTYNLAIGPSRSASATQYIYYASNIAAAGALANSVAVTLSSSQVGLSTQVFEYQGLMQSGVLDGTPTSGVGTGTNAPTANLSTTFSCDLLFSASFYEHSLTGVGTNYSIVNTISRDLVEHRVVNAPGSYTASSTQSPSGAYVSQLLALKKNSSRPPPPYAMTQMTTYTNTGGPSTMNTTYLLPQTAGNLNLVVIGFDDATNTVSSVTDSAGNTYNLAIGPTRNVGGSITQYVYYAKNIVGSSSNTVTVNFNTAVSVGINLLMEFSGLSTTMPLDVSNSNAGNGTSLTSGSVTTTYANELILSFVMEYGYNTNAGVGIGYSFLYLDPTDMGHRLLGQQKIVSSTGSYSATASLDGTRQWLMQILAFH